MADSQEGENEAPEGGKKNPATQKPSWVDKVRVSSSENRYSLSKVHHEINRDIPKIMVPNELTASSTPQWERCLVRYFPGSPMPFHAVKEIATKVWKTFGLEHTIASDGFFVFRFKDQDGLNAVLHLGPWLFGGKAFILQKWDATFSFNKNQIKKVPVWVKLQNLPLPLWTEKGLSFVSSILGNPIACDKATHEGTRLAYARVCVELEASRKPIRFFDLETQLSTDPIRVKVDYEWKPKWCSNCLLFGHNCQSSDTNSKKLQVHEDNDGSAPIQANPLPATQPLPTALFPPKESPQISNSNLLSPDNHGHTESNSIPRSPTTDISTPIKPTCDKGTNSHGTSAKTFNYKRALSIPCGPKSTTTVDANKSLKMGHYSALWGDNCGDNALIPIKYPDLEEGHDQSDEDLDFNDWGEIDNLYLPLPCATSSTPDYLKQICCLNTESSLGSIDNKSVGRPINYQSSKKQKKKGRK